MKKALLIAVVVAAAYVGYGKSNGVSPLNASAVRTANVERSSTFDAALAAFNEQKSGIQIQGEGMVSKILADDTDGRRHQRFILALSSGQTLLVAHNIDVAPRIATLQPGDTVAFNGVYEWSSKGGVVHWTHHDPAGRHEAGWLRHAGKTYQ